jgi:GDP-mannose 6-dehydrogenase
MNITVYGLGYVGCVTGACFADMGHKVTGVDPNPNKIQLINSGRSTIIEEGIQEIIEKVVREGSFRATTEWERSVVGTDCAFVCVGTPSKPNGRIELHFIKRVCEHIGTDLAKRDGYYVVVIRSTVFPGTVEETVIPILEKSSGKSVGKDFGVCMIPEFLREGSSVHDFYNPPKTVIGEFDKRSGDAIEGIFRSIKAPLVRTRLNVAEMIKYADNNFHALKVTFANEIGNICKELRIDSHKVMEVFCLDNKLNLSPYYLKPGFAFGGSCLPKDVRALTYEAKMLDVETPLLNAIMDSNRKQVLKVVKKLNEHKGSTIGFLGLSFKGGTDDLRESPHVEVIESMLGKGFKVKIYDGNVSIARLFGSNKEYIEKEIPHISSLMCATAKELIRESDVVVIGHRSKEFKEELLSGAMDNKAIVDLVRIFEEAERPNDRYYGICW